MSLFYMVGTPTWFHNFLGHIDFQMNPSSVVPPVSSNSGNTIQMDGGPEVNNAEKDLTKKAPKRGRPRKIKNQDSRNAANARERRR